ncbi:helix-turn-helix domain-containing protein [Effusibacillus dendaii]|uniref:Transcriptional regulator n=1 Tax=Effusibacillus dendaii TaxID=2743772 RepID=A0A7I8DAK0_9BACL|nr:XRE family transcriptional regulator [Effusibacillus dendaii]BCJ87213.1 transcriptional regulator [Effusibacillus dendaii]
MSFGTHVRKARIEKGLTLQDLSARSRVSRSMLSQIERGEKNPTLQVACQIAEGLDTTLSRLLGEPETDQVVVIRKEQRQVYRDASSGFERHLLSPAFPARGIEFILNIIPPGGDSGTFPPHKSGVKEYITVAKGSLQAILNNQTYLLQKGDSIFFEANVEHRFINIGEAECHYYLVIDSNTAGG